MARYFSIDYFNERLTDANNFFIAPSLTGKADELSDRNEELSKQYLDPILDIGIQYPDVVAYGDFYISVNLSENCEVGFKGSTGWFFYPGDKPENIELAEWGDDAYAYLDDDNIIITGRDGKPIDELDLVEIVFDAAEKLELISLEQLTDLAEPILTLDDEFSN